MIRNIESTLLLCECAEIINSLAYDVCNLNSWRRSFEKIWYWETDCTPMDPVVITCFMIGELSAYLGKGKAVYVRIGICYRECGANTLEFTFSDCLDTFWSEAVDDYRFFNADQTKKFDPNWSF